MCRSTDPRPKQWVLLGRTKEEMAGVNGDTSVTAAAISLAVDGTRYV